MAPKPEYNFIEFRNNMVRRTTRKRAGTDISDEELHKDVKTTVEPNMVTPTASNKRRRVASAETNGTKMDMETEAKVVDLTADKSTSVTKGTATEMEYDESITQTDDDENYSGTGGRRIDTPTSSPPSHNSNKIATLGGVNNGKLSRAIDSINISSPIISSVSKPASLSATYQQPIVVSKEQDVPLTKQANVADLVSDFVVIDKNTLEAETITEFENEMHVEGRSSIVRVFVVLAVITGMMFSIAFYASLPMSASPTSNIGTVSFVANNTHFNVVSKVVNMFDSVVDQVSKLDPRKNVSAVELTASKKEAAPPSPMNIIEKALAAFPFKEAAVEKPPLQGKMDRRMVTEKLKTKTAPQQKEVKPSKTEVKKETIKTKPIEVASPLPAIVEKEIKKPISSIYFIPGYQFVLR